MYREHLTRKTYPLTVPKELIYSFYVREHNQTIFYNLVASVASRRALRRNFNDFAVDVNASTLPHWVLVTPNLVNDGHDTTIDFTAQWIEYWLVPLLEDTNFNDNRTLILTFDKNSINNRASTLLLGGAIPESVRGTIDSTYYTHYSSLSTMAANWNLGSLGRGNTNKHVLWSRVSPKLPSHVYATGYKNFDVSLADIPLTNITGTIPGPLDAQRYVPFRAPDTSAISAGGGPIFVAPGLDTSITTPAPSRQPHRARESPCHGSAPAPAPPRHPNLLYSGHGKGATVLGALLAGVLALLLA
ncbi:hypothetical protein EDB87DRAFT_1577828 [Lactarius vividus]|nr:hypothetical protein EDB87DRAFT_1577828 [Lactarius vividus]